MKTTKMSAILVLRSELLRRVALVLALGLMVCLPRVSEAAPMGTEFTYQGHLYDANHVADGLYDFQFKLYDANVGGSKAANDVNVADIDVIDGYFTVELDFNDPCAFNGDARWLGIGVRPGDLNDPNEYTALSPRQKVTATLYALYAASGPGLPIPLEVSGSSFEPIISGINSEGDGVYGESSGGIGVRGYSLAGTGVSGHSDTGNGVYGSGLSGYAGYFQGDVYVSGSLGLGALSPTAKLHISGTPGVDGIRFPDGTLQTTAGTGGNTLDQAYDQGGSGAGRTITADSGAVNIAGSDGLTVNGNVGIGTTTPSFKLTLDNDGGVIAKGTFNSGANLTVSGAGTRLIWYPKKAAFRAGHVDSAQWDNANIGNYSAAMGYSNKASSSYATIGGGNTNTASAPGTTVGGGWDNAASQNYAAVGGGAGNTADSEYATVGGGQANAASGYCAFVGGGLLNAAGDSYASIGGGIRNNAGGRQATIAGGSDNTTSANYTVVGGGYDNTASALYATVSGGRHNSAGSPHATIGGGADNSAWDRATVAGGVNNHASNWASTVGGGFENGASGLHAVVGGGTQNIASGRSATVSGGETNWASGAYACVPGGSNNRATDYNTFAAGQRAKANHAGCFVWADHINQDFASTGYNQFLIRATGGVGIGVTDPCETLDVSGTARLRGISSGTGTTVVADAYGTLWKQSSSKRYKTNIASLEINPDAVLQLRPVSFQYKSSGHQDIGLIAEEVEEHLQDLVIYDNEGRPDAVKYDRVALYLLDVVKAQQEKIAALEQRLEALENTTQQLSKGKEFEL